MSLFHNRLFSSYTYLNITQFLGALIDNIYKFFIAFFLIDLMGVENSPKIMAMTGAVFVLPFLLFSASSGVLADRFSKRNIIVLTKILELVITAFSIMVFAYESEIGAYCILFLLATQSAIFGPSKYGIIPEIVSSEKISEANGLLTSFTFLAIIFGTYLATYITDITNRNFLMASIIGTFIALIGVITSFCIEYTPPLRSTKRFNILFLKEIYSSLKLARKRPSLLTAVLGSAFFLFLGAYLQLNLIPLAVQSLQLTDLEGGKLFVITALGIGCGSYFAGKISGKTAELGLVPIAAVGLTLCCFALYLFATQLSAVIPLVILAGMFGGLYEIPMDSYIQIESPSESRGQIIAATNFVSFFGVLVAAVLLYVNTEILGLDAAKGFAVVGAITLLFNIFVIHEFFDYFTRFVGTILSRLHFQTNYYGTINIPSTPAIFVCTHSAWNDTLLMLSGQRRRMRFFIMQEKNKHTSWFGYFYRLLRVVSIPSIDPLENNIHCMKSIQHYLKRGLSVCIFTDQSNVFDEVKKMRDSELYQNILAEAEYSLIPVIIEKGGKLKQPRFFKRLYHKFRVPASIIFGQGN